MYAAFPFFSQLLNCGIWTVYGLQTGVPTVIVPNFAGFAFGLYNLFAVTYLFAAVIYVLDFAYFVSSGRVSIAHIPQMDTQAYILYMCTRNMQKNRSHRCFL